MSKNNGSLDRILAQRRREANSSPWPRERRQRIDHHLVKRLGGRELASFKRDELQDFLDSKVPALSLPVVDHLRWDLKAIFDMAVAEGLVVRNPALMLFTPKNARKPVGRAMTVEEVQRCFSVLGEGERLIAKLAVLAGTRPAEISGIKWPQLTTTYADIRQRVYRGLVDTPKIDQSFRKAALSKGLLADVESWRSKAMDREGWVFPSEATTPMSKDNCWHRNMKPHLAGWGL